MENIQNNEQEKWMSTFVKVSIVHNSRRSSIKAKCTRCNICMANDDLFMWKHWKHYCPRNTLFEYVYPVNSFEKVAIRCLVCHAKFDTITLNFMASHRNSCKAPQGVSSAPNLGNNSESEASRLPLQTTNNNQQTASKNANTCPANNTSADSANKSGFSVDLNSLQFTKRIVYTLLHVGGNQVKEIAECQLCKRIFIINHIKLLQHRAQCRGNVVTITEPVQEFLENEPEMVNLISDPDSERESEIEDEVLFSVQTVSQPANIVNSENIPSNSNCNTEQIACFICNRSSNEPFADIYSTVSDSGTAIYDFIWQFLGNKPSVRNSETDASNLSNHVICKECLCSINQYEAARSTAKRFKKDIRQKLSQTEMYFEQLENQSDEQTQGNVEQDQRNPIRDTDTSRQLNKPSEIPNVIDLCEDD